jgi:hypothetical protein
MDPKPDVIRQQIDETRESLTDKLETLEGQVKQTVASVTEVVDSVRSKVEGTVEAVASSVEHTVETVKRTFDIPEQVQRHPFAMTGGALLAGAAVGWFVGRQRFSSGPELSSQRLSSYAAPGHGYRPPRSTEALAATESQPGFLSGMLEPVVAEFDKIKSTAIGALLGLARDAIRRSVPPALAEHVDEIMNNITRRAGGEPVMGRILPEHDDDGAAESGRPRS